MTVLFACPAAGTSHTMVAMSQPARMPLVNICHGELAITSVPMPTSASCVAWSNNCMCRMP